ncbi:unnamed protein product [Ranitomeya imitator]|uniref:Uncharacterized protein n=1 Tax=Ranitomeya imitator TaxID=111125 RepID=A0ABN9MIG6_9NEOB|nr:unnamed protein product [Ranitomeya imitator]
MWKRSSGAGTLERSVRLHVFLCGCTLRSREPAPELRFHMRDTDVFIASGNKPLRGDFVQQAFMDNDSKHTSRLCKGYLTKKESDGVLRQMTWPPQSPDLNPIEMRHLFHGALYMTDERNGNEYGHGWAVALYVTIKLQSNHKQGEVCSTCQGTVFLRVVLRVSVWYNQLTLLPSWHHTLPRDMDHQCPTSTISHRDTRRLCFPRDGHVCTTTTITLINPNSWESHPVQEPHHL